MPFDRKLLYSPFLGDFPLRFCCVPCHAKSRNNAGIWNFAISDEIFHVLDFLRMNTYSEPYYTYGYYRNPSSIYCQLIVCYSSYLSLFVFSSFRFFTLKVALYCKDDRDASLSVHILLLHHYWSDLAHISDFHILVIGISKSEI